MKQNIGGNSALAPSLIGLPEPNEGWMGEGQGLERTNFHTNLKCSLVMSITFII